MSQENIPHKNDIEITGKRNDDFSVEAAKDAKDGLDAVKKDISLGERRSRYWAESEKSNRRKIEETRRMSAAFSRLNKAVKAYAAAYPAENIKQKISFMLTKQDCFSGFSPDIEEIRDEKKGMWSRIKDTANNIFNPSNPKKELHAALKHLTKTIEETHVGIDFYRAAEKRGGITLDNIVKSGLAIEKSYQNDLGHDLAQERTAADLTKNSKAALPAAQRAVDELRLSRRNAADKIDDADAKNKKSVQI